MGRQKETYILKLATERKRRAASLESTRLAVGLFREAEERGMPPEFMAETLRLILAVARREWGELTAVNYADGKFKITLGRMEEIL